MEFTYSDCRGFAKRLFLGKAIRKREMIKQEDLGTEEIIPCSVRIHGQRCWGIESEGTGCTNPDCPRNNLSGGF